MWTIIIFYFKRYSRGKHFWYFFTDNNIRPVVVGTDRGVNSPESVHEHIGSGKRSGNVLGQHWRYVTERPDVGRFAQQALYVVLVERGGAVESVSGGGHRLVHDRKQVEKEPGSGLLQAGPRRRFRVLVHVPGQPSVKHVQQPGGRSFDAGVHVRYHPDRFAFGLLDHMRHVIWK